MNAMLEMTPTLPVPQGLRLVIIMVLCTLSSAQTAPGKCYGD